MYEAEYGRAGGAIVNAVTKSGTNKFSGVLFGYVASNALTSKRTSWPDQRGLPKARGREARVGLRAGRADRQEQEPLLRQPRTPGRQAEPHAVVPVASVARLLDRRGPQRLEHADPLRSPDQLPTTPGRCAGCASWRRSTRSSSTARRWTPSRTRPTSIRRPCSRSPACSAAPRSTPSASPRPGSTGGTATTAPAPRAAAAAGKGSSSARRTSSNQALCAPQLDNISFLTGASTENQGPWDQNYQVEDSFSWFVPGQEGRPQLQDRRALQLDRAAARLADQPERHLPLQHRSAVQRRQSPHLSRAAHHPHSQRLRRDDDQSHRRGCTRRTSGRWATTPR